MSKIDQKQVVYINSSDRLTGTDSNFTYQISLEKGNQFDRVTLLQASVPKSYYSVQASQNTFTLTENSSNITITVPQGNYNRSSLASTIKGLLNAATLNAYVYNVTFPNTQTTGDNGKYTFTVTTPSTVSLIFSTKNIYELLGFSKGSTNVFINGSLTSTNVINLQPYNVIQIHSDCIANPWQTGLNTDIMQSIIANTGSAPYSCIGWTCPEPESFSHNLASGSTSTCSFSLTDEDLIPIDTNGVPVQLVVMFWKKNSALRMISNIIRQMFQA